MRAPGSGGTSSDGRIAGGAMLIVPMVAGSDEFEGYVVILGTVAVTQGALILASVLVGWRTR